MKRSIILVILFLTQISFALASGESMPEMPRIKPTKTFTIKSSEQGNKLLEERGFGDQEPAVRMMNLMMVGGSGYEGMDMSKMPSSTQIPAPAEGQTATYDVEPHIIPNPPRVGANILEIAIQTKNTKKPATGLKLRAEVYMTSMNMGTETPAVNEVAPGKYRLKADFSMAGSWAVRIRLPEGGEKVLAFEAQ